MKTNIFDIRRFWQTLKWTVLTERKGLLTNLLGFLVAFLAIQLFSCFTVFDLTASQGSEAALGGLATCVALLGFMQLYYASGMLGNARQSRQRTTVLMLPASNVEKFTARLLYCVVIIPVLLVAVLAVATWLRMLLELMAGHSGIDSGWLFFKTMYNLPLSSYVMAIISIWQISIFVLGGLFFRQRPFIWTNVVLFAGGLFLFTSGFYSVFFIGEETLYQMLKPIIDHMTLERFECIANIVLTAFTVFNVWLSYKLYCRLQVVQHKWFNI